MYKRLVIDSNSVLMACLHACKKEGEHTYEVDFKDSVEEIPSHIDAYEYALIAFKATLRDLGMVPMQCVLVKDGKNNKALRQKFLSNYKKRPEKPVEFLQEVQKLTTMFEEMLWSYGGISVVKDGFEADDLIAAIASATDVIIWSKDGDLLAAGDWFWGGELNPTGKFMDVRKDRILAYKSLIGDPSDKIPGAKGFGEAAFRDMIVKYDDDVLDDILDMLKNRTLSELEDFVDDFKPFRKILDNKASTYASYDCARFYHPGYSGLRWEARFPSPNGDLGKWARDEKLVTKEVITSSGFMDDLIRDLHEGPVNIRGFDIETWMDEESLDWCKRNTSKTGKTKLDIVGCYMAGFSLTCGENNEKVYYFPVDHHNTDNISLEDMTMVLDMLPEDVVTMIHNVGYELPVVRLNCELRFDRGWLPNARCSQIMKSYVDENTELNLKYCTKQYLKYDQVSYDDVVGVPTGKKDKKGNEIYHYRQMCELTGEEVLSYGTDDAVATMAVGNLFDLIMRYEGTMDAFEACELLPAYLFAESQINGMLMDFDRLDELHKESSAKYHEIYDRITTYLGKLTWLSGDLKKDKEATKHYWEGCKFVPITSPTSTEIKRLFFETTGIELKTRLQRLYKIGELMTEAGYPHLGDCFQEGDTNLKAFNKECESMFVPNPQINLKSSPQLTELFYTALGLPVRKHNKITDKMRKDDPERRKGNASTDEDATKLAIAYDCKDKPELEAFLRDILAAKEERTAESFYYIPYPKTPNPKTGYTHYNPGQSRTTSRRQAPSGPNIGQVSKKSPIREAYVPSAEDRAWVSLDLEGQELKLTAHRSQCAAMLACYPQKGEAKDLHAVTGVEVAKLTHNLHTTYDELVKNKEEGLFKKSRDGAKAVNFGDIYGQTKYGLALKLIIKEKDAQKIIEAKEKAFPGVVKWKKERGAFHEKYKYATTMLGARKHLTLDNTWKDDTKLRSAINFEIQSPAAEQVKLILAEFWRSEFFERYDACFIFPVHDEVNFDCTIKDLPMAVAEAHQIMTMQYADMSVPITSSIEIGPSFGQLTNIGNTFDKEKLMEAIS